MVDVYGVWEPEVEDISDGTGTEPYHMSMMAAPTARGASKPQEIVLVGRKVQASERATSQLAERSQKLSGEMAVVNAVLTGDLYDIRGKTEQIERKIALLENMLITRSDTAGGAAIVTLTDVRVLNKKKGVRGATSKPTKTDLTRTTLLGKIRLLRGATYADVRRLIDEEFDSHETPADFKFYEIDLHETELLAVHKRQESRVPVETSVVYMVPALERA